MPKGVTIRFLVSMLIQLKYMVMVALSHLGLFKSPEEAAYSGQNTTTTTTGNDDNNYVLMLDGSSLTLVPVPVSLVTATIKKTLPLVQYSKFLQEKIGLGKHTQDVDQVCCSVCWDCIEKSHQIRELSNCSHVFHCECLDRWVDEGKVTCPLCRSTLLPSNTNPWMVLRNAYLSAHHHHHHQD